MAASNKRLGELHELFTEYLVSLLNRKDEDGAILGPTAAESAVIRAFLKDNNIQGDVDESRALQSMTNNLRESLGQDVSDDEFESIMQSAQEYMGFGAH